MVLTSDALILIDIFVMQAYQRSPYTISSVILRTKQHQLRRGQPGSWILFLLLFAKKSIQKKANPNPPPLRGSLRCLTGQAAAEHALRVQTVLADYP